MKTVWLILSKDVLVELRTREVMLTMGLFGVLIVVIFAFTFQLGNDHVIKEVAPGIIWVTLAFSGNLGIARVIDRERESGVMQALLLSPAGPATIFWAKALGVFIFIVATQLVVMPLALVFVGINAPAEGILLLTGGIVLGALGFALIGTLFGAMLADVRLREVLIPVIVFPIIIPVLIGGAELALIALADQPPIDQTRLAASARWMAIMGGFDLVYLALAPWLFQRVMVD